MAIENEKKNTNVRGINPTSYNLFADDPTECSWQYTNQQFCAKIKDIAQDMIGGRVADVKLKWYKSDEQTTFDPVTKQNKPVQKVVAEVWVDEDVACTNAAAGITTDQNPFMAQQVVSKFTDKMKAFIVKFCSDRDKEVYKNPSTKFADVAGRRRCYCIMIDIVKFVNIEWDIRGTGYKAATGSTEPAKEHNIDISFVWNDKQNKRKGIKLIKISKSARDNHRDLENRNPFISAKRKKHHDKFDD